MTDNADVNNNNDTQTYRKGAGVNRLTAVAGESLSAANRRAMNYLVHQMLWEQQEKFAADHWGPDGNMRVEDLDD